MMTPPSVSRLYPSPINPLHLLELITLGLLISWLWVAAFTVGIELYDGLDTLANANYFLGYSEVYVYNRSPLWAIVMMPAQFVKHAWALPPFDFRLNHATMALLHTFYLIALYRLLIHYRGRTLANLLAYLATIPTFIFFSYAPFISHDIFPGLLLLLMLLGADNYRKNPRKRMMVLLIALGAGASLIKNTFGLFWVAILMAEIVFWITGQSTLRIFKGFVLGALTAGAISWVGHALPLLESFPGTHFLLLPYEQIKFIAPMVLSLESHSPLWVYVRNLFAYGLLPTLLLLPGMILALRGNKLDQYLVLNWLILFGLLHMIGGKEVRYIAFLSPLTLFIVAKFLTAISAQKTTLWVAAGAYCYSITPYFPYSPLTEAAHIFKPFYQRNLYTDFFSPLQENNTLKKPVLVNWKWLNFYPDIDSPLAADKYHRHFTLAPHHIWILLGYQQQDVITIDGFPPETLGDWPPDSALVTTNGPTLAIPYRWQATPHPDRWNRINASYVATQLEILPHTDGSYRLPQGETIAFYRMENHPESLFITGPQILQRFAHHEFIRMKLPNAKDIFFVQRHPSGDLEIKNYPYPQNPILQSGSAQLYSFELKTQFHHGRLFAD